MLAKIYPLPCMEKYGLRQIKFLENVRSGEMTEKWGGIKQKFQLITEELFMKHCFVLPVCVCVAAVWFCVVVDAALGGHLCECTLDHT